MMWNWSDMGGYGLVGAFVGTAMMLILLAGLALLTIWAINSFSRRGPAPSEAEDILRRRLAAGEISPEEFQRLRQVLRGD